MDCVIFIGIQASGKSTFYQERFSRTHVRIDLDMLKTRKREARFVQTCLDTKQSFVADNTNPTVEDRARYIGSAKAAGFTMVGYFFRPVLEDSLRRNAARTGKECIPEIALYATRDRVERPTLQEGLNDLFAVSVGDDRFTVRRMPRARH